MTARRAVVAAGIGAIVVILALMLAHRGLRRSGTDRTPAGSFVVSLAGGQQACQGAELLPAGTAALRLTIGTYGTPGPPVEAVVTNAAGRTLTRGRLGAGWHEGIVSIPVERVSVTREPVQVCLLDRQAAGTPGKIAIAGSNPDLGYTMRIAGIVQQNVRVRIDYMRPGSETWLEVLPAIVHRFTLGKGGIVRHWAWIAVLLMLLAVALAVRVTLAERPPGEEAQR